jgi:uncharacterized protein (DUF305 family)
VSTGRYALGRCGRLVLAVAVCLAVASGGACFPASDQGMARVGSAPSPRVSVPLGRHNAHDVAFAQAMIVHHQQAIMMSRMAQTHAANAKVEALARRIEHAQSREVTQMRAWLQAWREPVPTFSPGMPSPDMMTPPMTPGMDDMPGMMSEEEMDAMREASGTMFDRMFLQMMIRHHEGAIQIAKLERREGVYPPAKKLAASIITTQTAEIRQMRSLLDQLR